MSVTTPDLRVKANRFTWRAVSELFASMRFAISLLVVLAIASSIGTVLKQDDPYPNYVNQFGPFWADIFRSLGLYQVYGSGWFMLILAFLMVSVSLCVLRNGPKAVADLRAWKDQVREGSLRVFHHKGEYRLALERRQAVAALVALLKRGGYRLVTREATGATLIAAKRGAFNKLGYIFAHVAIVVICLGGLLDSNLPIRLQMWVFGKSPVNTNAVISAISSAHRLAPSNPSFRGYTWVPEGQQVSTAILNEQDGSVIQDLPFSIHLDKFIVDYYSTGMPKLFASDIVVIDHRSGRRIRARVEVNKPFEYDGVSIYQSSFQDGGSVMHMTAYPMTGARDQPFTFDGAIGDAEPLPGSTDKVELTDFRAINVESMSDGSGRQDVRGLARHSLRQAFDARLGSGAQTSPPRDLRNIGPSVQYKIRGQDGQAREYNNYMIPVDIDGAPMFLAGMRRHPDDPFRYLRIPADADSSVKQWMLLRAALAQSALRAEAARRFAERSAPNANPSLRQLLQESAERVLTLFAGDSRADTGLANTTQPDGGFPAVARFIDKSVPKTEQEKAAGLLLRMLEGATWDLWQVARERAGQPDAGSNPRARRFIQDAINALSDSFYYGAPVFLHLDNFKQVQASVFQLTRAPGKKIVYLGSLLLVAGIFSMFFVRERRVWFWLKDAPAGQSRAAGAGPADVLMAMSSARKTLDFEQEFLRLRASVEAVLGVFAAGAATTNPDVSSQGDAPPHSTRS